MNRILVLSGHQDLAHSHISAAAIEAFRGLENVHVHELAREYPDFSIDVKREHRLLTEHDIVVMLFPFWWYSTPAILKEWQDKVLEHGFAYGSTGDRLHGKPFMLMISTGGDEQAYSASGYNHWPIEDFFLPFKAMVNLTGMVWQHPSLIQGANHLTDEKLSGGIAQWMARLQQLSALALPVIECANV